VPQETWTSWTIRCKKTSSHIFHSIQTKSWIWTILKATLIQA
jgi:hypothetical protein